ncbi:MAG: hypothetical protein OSJ70_06675 [Bacilli bacterium]|nr:hypothetical protein [Bacilli bacterium]
MELEKHTKEELKDFFNMPKLIINEKSVQYAFDILNKDSLFLNSIVLEKTNKRKIFFMRSSEKKMWYNFSAFKKAVEVMHKRQQLYSLTLDDYYRFYLLFSLLHEYEHLIQDRFSQERRYPYSDLNSAYQIVFDFYKKCSIMDVLINKYFHDSFFNERNVSINAAKISVDVFDDEGLNMYAETAYLNVLINNAYSIKNGQVKSPVEKTMNMLNIKHFSVSDELPFDIAFFHGFPISLEEYHYLYDAIYESIKADGSVDYDDTLERIQKLTLASKGVSTNR